MTTVSIAEFRGHLAKFIDKLVRERERIILEKSRIPVAVVVNYNEFEEIIDTLELLMLEAKPEVRKKIEEGAHEFKQGKTKPFADFAKEIGLKSA